MADLEVVFAPAAKRDIKKLDTACQRKTFEVLEALASDPRPKGVEKIQGHPKFYRVKVGRDFRLIYHIMQERLIIVLVIRDRKEAYQGLHALDDRLEAALAEVKRAAAL